MTWGCANVSPARLAAADTIPLLIRYPASRPEVLECPFRLLSCRPVGEDEVRYLSHAKLDIVRGFYRGVFRSKNWMVANAEFSEGEWTFLVVYGEREAQVKIEPHSRGVTKVDAVLSKSRPGKKPAPKEIPQKREVSPATQQPSSLPSSQSATPTPPLASQPAPTPDDYEDGGDDLGDDGGGDD